MKKSGNNFYITHKQPFVPYGGFKSQTIKEVFRFAHKMTFGQQGEHRQFRSGGSHLRSEIEIYENAFQGKLSEFAFANFLYKSTGDVIKPDLTTYELGIWEDTDVEYNNTSIAVKSTKHFGNLMLLECSDWSHNGEYTNAIDGKKTYDAIVLVRIYPDIGGQIEYFDNNEINWKQTQRRLESTAWKYDLPGYISSEDLKFLIAHEFKIPKGAFLNARIRMDADNYYVQAGQMKQMKYLSEILKNSSQKI